METLFTKIIQGKIPCYKIAENEDFFAFLDIHPNAMGHTLVVPKQPVDKLFDLDVETYQELFLYARKVAEAIEKVVACNRVGISVIGLEIPHAHVHLIPLNSMQDANFSKQKLALTPKVFEDLAAAISQQMEQ